MRHEWAGESGRHDSRVSRAEQHTRDRRPHHCHGGGATTEAEREDDDPPRPGMALGPFPSERAVRRAEALPPVGLAYWYPSVDTRAAPRRLSARCHSGIDGHDGWSSCHPAELTTEGSRSCCWSSLPDQKNALAAAPAQSTRAPRQNVHRMLPCTSPLLPPAASRRDLVRCGC